MSDPGIAVGQPSAGLFVIARPVFDAGTLDRLETIRSAHDPFHDRIGPHLTFVFGVQKRDADDIAEEVRRLAAGLPAFAFDAAFISVRHDVVTRRFYAGLIPERGVTAMLDLHARLHAGWLRKYLRRDIDFSPHITLARNEDIGVLDALADGLNTDRLTVSGRIASLEVVEIMPTEIASRATIALEEK